MPWWAAFPRFSKTRSQSGCLVVELDHVGSVLGIGRRIVEFEQEGRARADYGERIIEQLSIDLRNRLWQRIRAEHPVSIRAFHLAWRDKVQTVFGQSPNQKVQTLSGQLSPDYFATLRQALPLSWSQYNRLLSVENPRCPGIFMKLKHCGAGGPYGNWTGK